jgi:hypothetical protein
MARTTGRYASFAMLCLAHESRNLPFHFPSAFHQSMTIAKNLQLFINPTGASIEKAV